MVTIDETGPMKTVVLQLKPGFGAPMVMPVGPMMAPGGAPPGVVYVQQPPAVAVGTPVYYHPPETPVGPPPSRMGLFMGLRLGAIVPEGSDNITNSFNPGFDVGGEFNFRFARRWYVGAVLQHGFLGTPSSLTGVSSSTTNFGVVIGVLTNPDRFGALFQIGAGYRILNTSYSGASVDGVSIPDSSASVNSGEFMLGTGLWIPAGHHVRIVPRIDASIGSFSSSDSFGNPVSNTYAMISFDVATYFNLDFH
jgi:hypothetical protein